MTDTRLTLVAPESPGAAGRLLEAVVEEAYSLAPLGAVDQERPDDDLAKARARKRNREQVSDIATARDRLNALDDILLKVQNLVADIYSELRPMVVVEGSRSEDAIARFERFLVRRRSWESSVADAKAAILASDPDAPVLVRKALRKVAIFREHLRSAHRVAFHALLDNGASPIGRTLNVRGWYFGGDQLWDNIEALFAAEERWAPPYRSLLERLSAAENDLLRSDGGDPTTKRTR